MPPPKPLTEYLVIVNSMHWTGLLLQDEDIQEYYQQQVKTLLDQRSLLTLDQYKTDVDILKAVYTWNEGAHTNIEWALSVLKNTVDQLWTVNNAFYHNLDRLLEEEPQRVQAYLERCQKTNTTLVLQTPEGIHWFLLICWTRNWPNNQANEEDFHHVDTIYTFQHQQIIALVQTA